MFVNTFYKKFVQECAAKVAAQLAAGYAVEDLISDDEKADLVAIAAVNVAKLTAKKLEDYWRCEGDHKTVMFDPDDNEYQQLTEAVAVIPDALEDLKMALTKEPKD